MGTLTRPFWQRRGANMNARKKEIIAKSLWHAAIAGVGLHELRNNKSTLGKVLSVGLIAFHIDAAICDMQDKPTTLQRILHRMFP